MKRSELREIIREALQGYSKYTGTTQGGTSADFMKILTAIAKGEKSQVERGNDVLDRANQDNVDKITRGEKPVYEEQELQNYLVHYRVGEDDEDDVEVKATSPEEAIEKARAGKTAGGQSMPRLARGFSAKLYNN